MKAIQKISNAIRMLAISGIVLSVTVQCSEEEVVLEAQANEDMTTSATAISEEVASVSLTGVYTEFKADVECSTCSYIVGPNEKVVDGKALGLTSGSVICLKKSVKYAGVEFVNLEGTENKPITIGYCAK